MSIKTEQLYQVLPPLTNEEYEALKADIAERGIIVPVELDEDGSILDGHHRVKAWRELTESGMALPDYPRVVRGGMTGEQKRNYARTLNILRRHLSRGQLKEQWMAMRKDGATYQEIADATGVYESTVRRSVSANAETQPDYVLGKDGKKYPPKKMPKAPQSSIFTGSQVGEEKAKARAKKIAESDGGGADQQVQVTIFSHESKEYYTPSEYIEAACEVMGGIDLDPASCDLAQDWIKAGTYYTVADDGLGQKWFGRVWLNPPYSKDGNKSNQEIWSQRLISEYKARNISEAILLVKAALGYNWFENLWYDWPVCFAKKRISFIKSGGSNDGQSKQGTAFFYFGPNVERFRSVFRKFGRIIMPEASGKTLHRQ